MCKRELISLFASFVVVALFFYTFFLVGVSREWTEIYQIIRK